MLRKLATGLITTLLALTALATGLAQAAPTVSLSAPANNAKYLAPATFNVSASVTAETGSTITQVAFYANDLLIGTDTQASYRIAWTSVPAGSYTLTAVATDSNGASTTSAPRTVTVNADNTPPTVSLSAPANNSKHYAPASLTVSASASGVEANTPVSQVAFYANGVLIGSDTTSPYSIAWASPPAGTYTLTAIATDSAGASTTSAARTVTITASDTPPTVSLTAPANNSKHYAPASLTVSASASGVEINTPISQVEFYANGVLIGSDTASPYSIAWASPPAGTYTLTAIATDSAGASTTSAARTVTITASDTPPTVNLSAPANNAKYLLPANVTITASASGVESNTPVTQVEILDGATVLATLSAAPYTFTWANPPAGTHSLTARATDSGGATATSTARSITVSDSNTPPTVSLSAPANNATVQAPVDVVISANASAPEVNDSITQVDFYQGSTLIGSATAKPYTITWINPAAGVYTLTAKATDGQGAITTSAARKLTVLANQLPAVSLTSPTDSQSFTAPASIPLTATASDAGGAIAKVEFYQGTTLIGTATAAPYTASWADVPEGSYSLTAKAIDSDGAETWSAAIAITVTSGAPKLYYLHSDHLDTPRLVTDEMNKVVWRNMPLNEPFGNNPPEEDADGDGQRFTMNLRFPGQYADRETNLVDNGFRTYDPLTGRYVQSDPIGLQGGINTYTYVGGNPLSYTDPRGLNPAAGAVAGGMIGGPVGAVIGGVIGFGAGLYIGSQIMESRGSSDPVVLPPVNPGRDCDGKCLPCPQGAKWWVPKPGHGHAEGYWHVIVYNQDPRTCMCYPDRPSQGLEGK